MKTVIGKAALALAATLLLAPAARAEGAKKDCGCDHDKPAAAADAKAAQAPADAGASVRLPDQALLDERGASRRLVSDVIGDRIVVLDFVFTTCTTVCPLLSGIMSGVQDGLGESLGKEVVLVSITVDPARDTPARLEAYARKWKARAGWTFLTGEREAVKRVLEAAGTYTPDFTDHPPMVLVGDGKSGRWVRLNGFPKRAQVLAEVEAMRTRRATLTAKTEGGAR